MSDVDTASKEPSGGDVKVHDNPEAEEVKKEAIISPSEGKVVCPVADAEGDVEEEDVSDSEAPPEVQRRVKALKKIQMDVARTESDFFKEMHELEMKYADKYTDFFDKRRVIVLGKYEPTDKECKFNCGGADKPEENGGLELALSKLKLDERKKAGEEIVPGIPDFWLTIFQNVDLLSEMIQEQDLPILKHLTDVKVEMTTSPMGFKLFFHFSPNDYFSDAVLTKTYEMKCEVDTEDPFSFEGPEIFKCSGCTIDWKEGKNVTVKVVRKKQKHKQTGSVRMVNKTVEVPSFFDFFNPPEMQEEKGAELDEEAQLRLTNHFEVGQYIRERIVPRAVLYYTGEALEDEDEDDDYDEEEEETEGENDASGNSANPEDEDDDDAE